MNNNLRIKDSCDAIKDYFYFLQLVSSNEKGNQYKRFQIQILEEIMRKFNVILSSLSLKRNNK